jgi:pimeloyl-ACP methyl ester carboxylesterase
MLAPTVRFAYADTHLGQLHYAEAGAGTPVLLLHQTPRSWDEYREVLPLLGQKRRAIAMDMYGFGMSAKPRPGVAHTIELFAQGAIALMDALGIEEFAVVGHHTGMFVASEVASAVPDRVRAAVFSGSGYPDPASREAPVARTADESSPHTGPDGIDVAPIREDGSHLTMLWDKRYPLYPQGRPDILDRFVRDALAEGVDPAEGHRACKRYRMADRTHLVNAPILLLANTEDPFSYPQTDKVAASYRNAKSLDVVEIEGGMIPVMEQQSAEVAAALERFFNKVGI